MTTEKNVLDRLRKCGWNTDCCVVPVAIKFYETVVGQKQAWIWVRETPSDQYHQCVVTSQYDSEGRNILSTNTILITRGMTRNEIHKALDDFLENLETVIAASYAVRLLRQP